MRAFGLRMPDVGFRTLENGGVNPAVFMFLFYCFVLYCFSVLCLTGFMLCVLCCLVLF